MKKAFTLLLAMLVLMTVAGAVPAAAEVTIDYGFEQGENNIPAGWRANTSTEWEWVENAEAAKEGEKYITVSSGIFYTELTSDIAAGDTYSIGFWYKGEPRVIVYKNEELPVSSNKIADSNTAAALTAAEDWTWAEMTVTPGEDVTGCIIELRNKNSVPTSYDGMTVSVKANTILESSGFETGNDGWTLVEKYGAEIVTDPLGVAGNCLKIGEGAQQVIAKHTISLKAATNYKISLKVMARTAGGQVRISANAADKPNSIYINNYNGAGENVTLLAEKDTWYSFTTYFTSVSAAENTTLDIRGDGNAVPIYYDDIVVEEMKDDFVAYHASALRMGNKIGSERIQSWGSESTGLESLPSNGGNIYAYFRANSADAAKKFLAMTCVYETEGGKTTLYNVATALAGTETEAAAAHATLTVNVPASAGGKTYTVKSFMWDSAAGLNPYIVKAAVLQ